MRTRRAQIDAEVIEDAFNSMGRRWGITVLKTDRRPKLFEAVLKSKASEHLVRATVTPGRKEGDVFVVFQEEVPEQYLSWMRSPHRYEVTTSPDELRSLFDSLMKPIAKDWSRDVKEGSAVPSLRKDLLKLAHSNPDGIRKHLVPLLRQGGSWVDEAIFQTGEELRENYVHLKWKKGPYRDSIEVSGPRLDPVLVFKDERVALAAALANTIAAMEDDPSNFDARYIEPFLSTAKQQALNVAYEYAFAFIEGSVQGTMSGRDLEREMDKAGLDWDEDQIEEDREGAEDALLNQLMKDWADDMERDPVRWYEEHHGELFLSQIPYWMDFAVEEAAEEYIDSVGLGESFQAGTDEIELDGGAILIPFGF